MKKGIEVYTEFDPQGHCVLVIRKQRGKLTLEEIRAVELYEMDDVLEMLGRLKKL